MKIPRSTGAVLAVVAVTALFSSLQRNRASLNTQRAIALNYASRSDADRASRPPKVYVYEIPEELLPKDAPCDVTRGWESLECWLWRAFEDYKFRVFDPERADLFVVPHITTRVYHSSFNHSQSGQHLLRILDYVTRAFPFVARSAGADHVAAFAHDSFGNVMTADQVNSLPSCFRNNFILIVNQGDDGTNQFGKLFEIRRDIIAIQPTWRAPAIWAEKGLQRKPWSHRRWLAVFRGSIQHDVPAYSGGFRQALDKFMRNDADILWGDYSGDYAMDLLEAKFCLFLRGWHVWSERLGTIINAGCIPVIISDHYALPFWAHLDWSAISIRIPQADALRPGHIKSVLRNVSEARALQLESNIASVQRSLQYNLPPQAGDVFSRVLHELSDRLTDVRPSSGRLTWR